GVDPKYPCRAPVDPNDPKVFLGYSFLVVNDTSEPLPLVRQEVDLVTIGMDDLGVYFDMKVFASDGKLAAEIVRNQLTLNPRKYFEIDRPDAHHIVVRDRYGVDIL